MFDMALHLQPGELAAIAAALTDLATRIDRLERTPAAQPPAALSLDDRSEGSDEWIWDGNRAWRRTHLSPSKHHHTPPGAAACRDPRHPKNSSVSTRPDTRTALPGPETLIDNFIDDRTATAA
jgi:hypothetical protein